jgi:predicted dinucleotide-binding enzyme
LDLLVVAVIGAGLLGLGLRLRWSAARNAATA